MKSKFTYLFACFILLLSFQIAAQNIKNNPTSNHGNKFEQLGTILTTPNEQRTASGAPGTRYWQQKANYDIDVTLDEVNKKILGKETITYFNFSPDGLDYLWLQLDENEHKSTAPSQYFDSNKFSNVVDETQLKSNNKEEFLKNLGVNIESVTDANGNTLPFTINNTMMRVDLKRRLDPYAFIKLNIKWNYTIGNRMVIGGRGGYEYFAEDKNYIFTISQWFPRLCVYSDFQGWQHKQFTGRGEFALVFGNYKVKITVPQDHIVCATGECQNYEQVLTPTQLKRWQAAQQNKNEVTEIVTLQECIAAETSSTTNTKTWIFKADSVRDFAWGSSRKFMWDAMPIKIENKKITCMSFYPKEAAALYRKYSTKTVAHTLRTYSKFTVNYPYPVAQSVEAANGMEYPMICFNFGRTEKDGTYSESTKYGMLGVIIHEVGHNFFPMIINSDERQWSWFDEGLNTFVQYLTEQEFDNNYPSHRGPAYKMVDYLKLPKDQLEPIMTNSDNIIHFGPNAYGKPCTALNILRETIMGRKLFDFAFKTYCKRWAFKHPTPADFFRTMEDASAVDLDWFWRAWFYDIEPVDISLDSIKAFKIVKGLQVPIKMDTTTTWPTPKPFEYISKIRNRESNMPFLVDTDTTLRDFYFYYKPEIKTEVSKAAYNRYKNYEVISDSSEYNKDNLYGYELHFTNKGGCVSPIIIQFNYKDSTSTVEYVDVNIWRKNENHAYKTFLKQKGVVSVLIDPYKETADINEANNTWNITEPLNEFELFKTKQQAVRGKSTGVNPMQKTLNKASE